MVGLTSALRAPAVSAIVAVTGRSNAQLANVGHWPPRNHNQKADGDGGDFREVLRSSNSAEI
jgi:hypothetical protein